MKQHITPEEITELSESQKRSLQDQWSPRKYDLVLANICVDVENEAYEQTQFVLGDIRVFGTSLYLWDIRVTITKDDDNEPGDDGEHTGDSGNDSHRNEVGTNHEEDVEPDNFYDNDSEHSREAASGSETMAVHKSDFVFYNKEDCYPLLNIGQMIEILRKNSYGDVYFYTTIGIGEDEECGVGRDGCARDYESPELCDALWESLKAIL